MKRDRSLFVAIIVLIGLVLLLIVITLSFRDKGQQINNLIQKVTSLEQKIETFKHPKDGRSPVEGIDYTVHTPAEPRAPKDGQNAVSTNTIKEVPVAGKDGDSAYQIAVKHGFEGSEEQWLESNKTPGAPGADGRLYLQSCLDGKQVYKYEGDAFWKYSISLNGKYLKCEEVDE